MKTPIELMRLRVEALYTHDERSRLVSINQWDGGIAPRFYLGRTVAGNVCRFHRDFPIDLVDQLQALCATEPSLTDFQKMPQYTCPEKFRTTSPKAEMGQNFSGELYHDEYVRLLTAHAPIERLWSGPAYLFESDVVPSKHVVAIHAGNANLLRGGLEDWIPDVPHRQPFVAMIEDDHAVAICASVRICAESHEAGVETLPEYRRKGHALNAVAGWAAAVRELGLLRFYSTSWENIASQKIAARLSLSMIGTDFSIT